MRSKALLFPVLLFAAGCLVLDGCSSPSATDDAGAEARTDDNETAEAPENGDSGDGAAVDPGVSAANMVEALNKIAEIQKTITDEATAREAFPKLKPLYETYYAAGENWDGAAQTDEITAAGVAASAELRRIRAEVPAAVEPLKWIYDRVPLD